MGATYLGGLCLLVVGPLSRARRVQLRWPWWGHTPWGPSSSANRRHPATGLRIRRGTWPVYCKARRQTGGPTPPMPSLANQTRPDQTPSPIRPYNISYVSLAFARRHPMGGPNALTLSSSHCHRACYRSTFAWLERKIHGLNRVPPIGIPRLAS